MPPHEPLVCLAALPPVTLYALGGFIVFMFFVQIVIARWEKRMVWPYGSPEAEPQFPDPSGYGKRWVRNAFEAGFTFYGWCPDLKGPRYRVSYGLLAPPSGDCFVVVGVGTIFSLQLRGTWIYSRTIDGQVFYTTDHQSCVEIDPARRWRNQLTKTDNFPALLKSHRETVRARGIAIQPFDTGHEVEQFKQLRQERYESMARAGLITFVDPSSTHFKYTLRGASKSAALNYSIGLARGVTSGRLPKIA